MTEERIAEIAQKHYDGWTNDPDPDAQFMPYMISAIREALAEEREAIWKAALTSESRIQGND